MIIKTITIPKHPLPSFLAPYPAINPLKILFILYFVIHYGIKKSKYFEKPNNDGNYHHDIENLFDFVIHWYVGIDHPKQKTNNYNNDKNIYKWHNIEV
nr:hypothetical protein [Lacihabitans sp. LS3-19]